MILDFKTTNADGEPTGFVSKILSGPVSPMTGFIGIKQRATDAGGPAKIHTLREDKNRLWQPGKSIQFSTGRRTSKYEQFAEGTCTSTQRVRINNHGILMISIDDRFLTTKAEMLQFIQNDGFDTEKEFEAWFAPLIARSWKVKQQALVLKLIHWTPFRYEP